MIFIIVCDKLKSKQKNMLIKVKVFPNEKKDEIIKKSEDSFIVKVKEKAELGQANKAVIWLLSLYFKIPGNRFRIKKGGKERNKIIEIITYAK